VHPKLDVSSPARDNLKNVCLQLAGDRDRETQRESERARDEDRVRPRKSRQRGGGFQERRKECAGCCCTELTSGNSLFSLSFLPLGMYDMYMPVLIKISFLQITTSKTFCSAFGYIPNCFFVVRRQGKRGGNPNLLYNKGGSHGPCICFCPDIIKKKETIGWGNRPHGGKRERQCREIGYHRVK
jgi:hypothetical protein